MVLLKCVMEVTSNGQILIGKELLVMFLSYGYLTCNVQKIQ
jgi:hypothetical protein